MKKRWNSDVAIAQVLRSESPEAAVQDALRGVDRGVARREVLARLGRSEDDALRTEVLCRILGELNPGEVADEIVDLLVADGASDERRLSLMSALARAPLELIGEAMTGDRARADAVGRALLYGTVRGVHDDPRGAEAVHALVSDEQPPLRPQRLAEIEAARRSASVSPTTLYASMLRDPALSADDRLRGVMLDAVVSEGSTAGSELLQSLRAGAPKKLRAPFQVALLKLETARISGGSSSAAPRCWCSAPDGQGAVVALAAFANPDKTHTLVDLCFRLGRDLRQGFVVPRAPEREVGEVMRELTADGAIVLAPVPAGELGTIIEEASASHARMGVRIPEECVAPLRALQRLPRIPLPANPPPRAPTVRRVTEILATKRHEAWFFDAADLTEHLGAGRPSDGRTVAERLAGSALRDRVERLADFMVHWSRWKGELDGAAEWCALALGLRADFARSPLVEAMLAASPAALMLTDDVPDGDYGTTGILFSFRELFPELAEREIQRMSFRGHRKIPDGDYRLEELYCTSRECNCERVLFSVVDDRTGREVCRVGHAFTPASAWRFFTKQTVLDPLSAAPRWASALVSEIHAAAREPACREALRRHYELSRSL